MANYRGHMVGAAVVATGYVAVLHFVPVEHFVEMAGVLHDWQAIVAVYVVAVLMGLFPDIDTNSKGQNFFFGIALAADVLLIYGGYLQAAAYLGLIAMLPVVGRHRGWTHSKWAMMLVPLPIVAVPYLYNAKILPAALVFYGAAVAGYFSHLLLDGEIIKRFRIKT